MKKTRYARLMVLWWTPVMERRMTMRIRSPVSDQNTAFTKGIAGTRTSISSAGHVDFHSIAVYPRLFTGRLAPSVGLTLACARSLAPTVSGNEPKLKQAARLALLWYSGAGYKGGFKCLGLGK